MYDKGGFTILGRADDFQLIVVGMKVDFLEEAAFLMGLKEGGLCSKEMMNKDVLGGRDPKEWSQKRVGHGQRTSH